MDRGKKPNGRAARQGLDEAALDGLSKEELVDRVKQLQTQCTQLKNVIAKSVGADGKSSQKRRAEKRQFDFSRYNTRHVALKVAYLGWDYQGFAAQDDTNRTIEAVLFEALLKTRLIESRETSCYHRCGRTDKGVSAFSQVISIDLRTNLLEGTGVKVREGGSADKRPGDKLAEIPYVHILNKVLPTEVRVLAWTPVGVDFSARFSCKSRTYKYFFPRGNLNLEAMQAAGQALIGERDYRNFCKMDVANGVVSFTRRILFVDIQPACASASSQPVDGTLLCPYEMVELTVCGLAFLWHQIRCIVALLFLVGEGREQPTIVEELLDVDKHPRKPQYSMASELPLVLFDCQFEGLDWIYDTVTHEETTGRLKEVWTQHSIRATMVRRMLDALEATTASLNVPAVSSTTCPQTDCLVPGNKPRNYRPLLERETCESLDERIGHYSKKRKANID